MPTENVSTEKRYRIIRLEASNVRRLRAVAIEPPTNGTMIVAGNNGHGKTSLLDSFMLALAGGKAEYEKAIRQGQDQAEITLDMGEFIAHRIIRRGRQTLELKTPEGHIIQRPQKFLDGIIGELSFDPLQFTRLYPRDRVAMLMNFAGLTDQLGKIEAERDKLFDDRKGVNRSLRDAEGALRECEKPDEDTLIEEVQVQPLLEKKNRRQSIVTKNEHTRAAHVHAQKNTAHWRNNVREAEEALLRAKALLVGAEANEAELAETVKSLADPDIAEIDAQIVQAQHTNKAVEKVRAYQREVSKVEALTNEANELTKSIKFLDRDKAGLLAQADFPIDGLSFDGTDVLYNGIHFSELSSAETLRVSLAMAMAMNPQLRVIRITDGSLLDDDGMKIVSKAAKEHDYQVLIECVGNREDAAVIIEDGEVRETAVAHA